jgi:signal transduction histidine kinase
VSSAILRLTERDFEAAARQPRALLRYRSYDSSDGLVGVPLRGGFPGAVRRAGDDTLWFVTSRGASLIRPGDLHEGGPQPSMRIESVRAGDRNLAVAAGAALDPGTSRISFEYTAVNLTSPLKERFRYRLQGADDDWVEAGSRREAFYPNLGSGNYRFEVERITDDHSPGAAATWAFTIRPMFYQTWWFLCGCVVAVALAAWAAWRIRLRQLRRQFAVVFAERARMSRELHDTLLQDLVGISLHFDELATTIGTPASPISNQIVKLRRYLQRSIGEARQVVWDLRSSSADDGGLPTLLRESGERILAGGCDFSMTSVGTPVRCAAPIEQHVLRIAQEALRNAARYANATSVRLMLEYRDGSLLLEIVDDGSGFEIPDAATQAAGHYGFLIMRERAEQIGGRFVVESAPGRGTRIEVIVPTGDPVAAVPMVS